MMENPRVTNDELRVALSNAMGASKQPSENKTETARNENSGTVQAGASAASVGSATSSSEATALPPPALGNILFRSSDPFFEAGGEDDEGEPEMEQSDIDALDKARLSLHPNMAFDKLFPDGDPPQAVQKVVPGKALLLHGAPEVQPPGTVRFVCISDTHGRHRRIEHMPPGDVLLHAGDITNTGELQQLEDFSAWLGSLKQYKHKVVIAGNHDVTLHREYYTHPPNQRRWHGSKPYDVDACQAAVRKNCIFLEDEACEVEGYTIYGSPWQPEFYNWAYNLPRGEPCRRVWAKIPKKGVDILMTHGPPIGHGGEFKIMCCLSGSGACVLRWLKLLPLDCGLTMHLRPPCPVLFAR